METPKTGSASIASSRRQAVPITVTDSQDGYWTAGRLQRRRRLERPVGACVCGGRGARREHTPRRGDTGQPLVINVPNIGPIVTYARFRYGSERQLWRPPGWPSTAKSKITALRLCPTTAADHAAAGSVVTQESVPLTAGLQIADPDAALGDNRRSPCPCCRALSCHPTCPEAFRQRLRPASSSTAVWLRFNNHETGQCQTVWST